MWLLRSHTVTQNEVSDLMRYLDLSKSKTEISRLQQWNLLDENVNIPVYWSREQKFTSFFAMQDSLVICANLNGVMEAFSINYNPEEWSLFIDSSSMSLRAVLLHVGNKLPTIPIGCTVHTRESYENLKLLLEAIEYCDFQWSVMSWK